MPRAQSIQALDTFSPPSTSALAPIETAVLALVGALEGQGSGPASRAYVSAIRRQGVAAAAEGGSEAMAFIRARVVGAAPHRAEERATIINTAWTGLPGWEA